MSDMRDRIYNPTHEYSQEDGLLSVTVDIGPGRDQEHLEMKMKDGSYLTKLAGNNYEQKEGDYLEIWDGNSYDSWRIPIPEDVEGELEPQGSAQYNNGIITVDFEIEEDV